MAEAYTPATCYDHIAKLKGEEVAQALWEKNGGAGKYVPGMIAVRSMHITESGSVFYGHVEPGVKKPPDDFASYLNSPLNRLYNPYKDKYEQGN